MCRFQSMIKHCERHFYLMRKHDRDRDQVERGPGVTEA